MSPEVFVPLSRSLTISKPSLVKIDNFQERCCNLVIEVGVFRIFIFPLQKIKELA